MKHLQRILFEGYEFQYVEDCGLQLVESGELSLIESSEETRARKELTALLDSIENDNDFQFVNCGNSGQSMNGTLFQILEAGNEVAEIIMINEKN